MNRKDFDRFIFKYGVPASILLGAGIIGMSIYVSFGLLNRSAPAAPSNANVQGNPADIAVQDIDTDGLPSLGSANAPVAVIEFGDFQCPFCGRLFSDVLTPLKQEYIATGKVRFYFSDFAFLGQESQDAAMAAKCADEQGEFWSYHDYLFQNQSGENRGAFSRDNLKSFAGILGLNTRAFAECLDSGKYKQAVEKETSNGRSYGVSGTPSTFVNGRHVRGAVPYESFVEIVEEELQKN